MTVIEPNPVFQHCSEVPAGKIPDMTVLHHFDSHYSLIVPDTCWLAINGGLDYQREVSVEEKNSKSFSSESGIEDRIIVLEKQFVALSQRCLFLEKTNESLKKKFKTCHQNMSSQM